MQCNYQKTDKEQIFAINGKLDQESYAEFDLLVNDRYSPGQDVVLDVTQLDYVSSVGLRSFIALAKLVRNDKHNINIRAKDGSMVKQLITLSGFAKLMPFID